MLLGQLQDRQTLPDAPAEFRPNLQLRDLVFHGVPSPGQASTLTGRSGQSYVDTSPQVPMARPTHEVGQPGCQVRRQGWGKHTGGDGWGKHRTWPEMPLIVPTRERPGRCSAVQAVRALDGVRVEVD